MVRCLIVVLAEKSLYRTIAGGPVETAKGHHLVGEAQRVDKGIVPSRSAAPGAWPQPRPTERSLSTPTADAPTIGNLHPSADRLNHAGLPATGNLVGSERSKVDASRHPQQASPRPVHYRCPSERATAEASEMTFGTAFERSYRRALTVLPQAHHA